MGTGDDPREPTTGFSLVLSDRIEDAGMIGAKIDEAMRDSSLALISKTLFNKSRYTHVPQSLEEGRRSRVFPVRFPSAMEAYWREDAVQSHHVHGEREEAYRSWCARFCARRVLKSSFATSAYLAASRRPLHTWPPLKDKTKWQRLFGVVGYSLSFAVLTR